jgi:hypothetical protein
MQYALFIGRSRFQILFKEINGTFPGEFCGGFIISWGGIVMETVVGALVNKGPIFFVVCF